MSRGDRLPPYWREALLVLVVALPWLSLLVLGIVWLWQGGHVWIWALAAAAIGLLSWPLWYSVRRRSKEQARIALGDLAQPSREWHVAERDAWSQVLAIADETAPLNFLELDPLLGGAAHHAFQPVRGPLVVLRLVVAGEPAPAELLGDHGGRS